MSVAVSRCMRALMSDELAAKLSVKGRKHGDSKASFMEMGAVPLILGVYIRVLDDLLIFILLMNVF